MAALAHQFAGLISPLHGLFSADNLPARATICLINEVCPPMLAGPKQGHFRPQKGRPAITGFTASNWRGLYGRGLFSSMWQGGRTEAL